MLIHKISSEAIETRGHIYMEWKYYYNQYGAAYNTYMMTFITSMMTFITSRTNTNMRYIICRLDISISRTLNIFPSVTTQEINTFIMKHFDN